MSEIVRQATCVAIGRHAVLIEGEPGSGKSSLALALIDRGAKLVGDDGIVLKPSGARLLACPHPNIRGLIEVRNLGLLRFPATEEVPIALVLRLDRAAPRFIEAPDAITLAGCDVPLVCLWPDGPNLALKAELALKTYGLFQG
ncbi:MAG: HPr kinase/phosphorylase [Novosphingobium sp.]